MAFFLVVIISRMRKHGWRSTNHKGIKKLINNAHSMITVTSTQKIYLKKYSEIPRMINKN